MVHLLEMLLDLLHLTPLWRTNGKLVHAFGAGAHALGVFDVHSTAVYGQPHVQIGSIVVVAGLVVRSVHARTTKQSEI